MYVNRTPHIIKTAQPKVRCQIGIAEVVEGANARVSLPVSVPLFGHFLVVRGIKRADLTQNGAISLVQRHAYSYQVRPGWSISKCLSAAFKRTIKGCPVD